MLQPLDNVTLKTGEAAQLAVVRGPEPGDPWQVAPLLGHKGGAWNAHIEGSLAGPQDGLETRYYVARVGELAVSNVMLVEYAGAGILGHVFTVPEQRRKGLCEHVITAALGDFTARGGTRLILGTGYDSAPYWIYHRHGFRPLLPNSGFMAWQPAADFAARWYRADGLRAADFTWRHWPALAQLWADDWGGGLQALAWGAFGPANFEGPGVALLADCAEGRAHARVLENGDGVALALAVLTGDRRWPGVWNLDLIGHPDCDAALGQLVAALPRPGGKLQAWLPAGATARRAGLAEAGWQHEATLAGQLPSGGDVVVYSSSGS